MRNFDICNWLDGHYCQRGGIFAVIFITVLFYDWLCICLRRRTAFTGFHCIGLSTDVTFLSALQVWIFIFLKI